MPFLIFRWDHLRFGIICSPFGDHFRSGDHLRSGIICGAVHLQVLQRFPSLFQFPMLQKQPEAETGLQTASRLSNPTGELIYET